MKEIKTVAQRFNPSDKTIAADPNEFANAMGKRDWVFTYSDSSDRVVTISAIFSPDSTRLNIPAFESRAYRSPVMTRKINAEFRRINLLSFQRTKVLKTMIASLSQN